MVGRASVTLNDHKAVNGNQALACLVHHLGCPPNDSLMSFILYEYHQKEVIMYYFLSVFSTHAQTVRVHAHACIS